MVNMAQQIELPQDPLTLLLFLPFYLLTFTLQVLGSFQFPQLPVAPAGSFPKGYENVEEVEWIDRHGKKRTMVVRRRLKYF